MNKFIIEKVIVFMVKNFIYFGLVGGVDLYEYFIFGDELFIMVIMVDGCVKCIYLWDMFGVEFEVDELRNL